MFPSQHLEQRDGKNGGIDGGGARAECRGWMIDRQMELWRMTEMRLQKRGWEDGE